MLDGLFDKAIAAVPRQDLLPVLKNFRLEADDNSLRVTATDLELSILVTTNAVTVKTPGVIVLPAKKMMAILQQTPDGLMTIDVEEDNTAQISHSGTIWRLRLPKGDDYPLLPDMSVAQLHEINREQFIDGLVGVRNAAATDSVRPSLLMIDISEGKFTACDGVRFQQVRYADFPLDMRVPINAVDDLLRLLRIHTETTIRAGSSDNHLVFEVGSDVFLLRQLTTNFAPVEELLLRPAMTNKDKLSVNRTSLLSAVKRVRITADAEISGVTMDLAENEITVSARDSLGNVSWEAVPSQWSGKERQVTVNHQYLTDLLNMYSGPVCDFYFGPDTKTRKSAVLLRDDRAGTFGVIAQMRKAWINR